MISKSKRDHCADLVRFWQTLAPEVYVLAFLNHKDSSSEISVIARSVAWLNQAFGARPPTLEEQMNASSLCDYML